MSRHRIVRNMTEDDYYDDYDDYYEDEDYYEDDNVHQEFAPPALTALTPPVPKAPTQTHQISVPGKAATTASVGVAKPPPGWGKPSSSKPSDSISSSSSGVAKPPPGWGKPAGSAAKSPPIANLTSAGLSTPPPGWGKPGSKGNNTPSHTAPSVSVGVSKPLDVSGKPSASSSGNSTPKAKEVPNPKSSTPSSNKSTPYVTKPLPPCLNSAKSQLSMVVLGHVDAGKSTLMGQVLVQVGTVSKRDAQKNPVSWILDENEQERERGVTMEIGTKTVRVPNHDIVLLDAPGHADFVPIMITGAANADVAILVVAANRGEFEAGFDGGGQTKEHILLARGLGVSQVLVAVNKLDMEDWSKDRYEQIQSQVKEYLLQQQFRPKRIRFVPLSGLTGENVKSRNDQTLSTWYKGPTLLEAMNDFQPAKRQYGVYSQRLVPALSHIGAHGKGVVARGRVMQGFLEAGERLVVMPIGDVVTVSKLAHLQPPTTDETDKNALKRLDIAIAGDTVELVVSGIDLVRLSVGTILANPNARPELSKKAKVKVLVLDSVKVPIIRGAQVLFHMQSLDVPAVISKLVAITKSDGSVTKERPRALTRGMSAIVELTLSDKIVLETFANCRALGRFVLRRAGDTIAVGVIDEVL
eukprot:scaffold221_cov120-Cylindrotheca_fusiformis.AAC.17